MNTVRLNGIIAIAVSNGLRPCTIWMYSGTVKFNAASRATTMNIAYTAARSVGSLSTPRSTSGVLPAAARRRVHQKNTCAHHAEHDQHRRGGDAHQRERRRNRGGEHSPSVQVVE